MSDTLTVHEAAVPRGEQASPRKGHVALTLPCPLCERETSQSVFIKQDDSTGTKEPSHHVCDIIISQYNVTDKDGSLFAAAGFGVG